MSSIDHKLAVWVDRVAFRMGLLAGYLAGLKAGYQAKAREEVMLANTRSGISGGRWFHAPSQAEREAERLAVIREAHDAGLHGEAVYGCPDCPTKGDPLLDVLSRKPHNGDYGVPDHAFRGHDGAPCLHRVGDGFCDQPEGVHARPCDGLGCSCCSVNPCTCISDRLPPQDDCPVHAPHPCAGGCSDPDAHAEGAHDV